MVIWYSKKEKRCCISYFSDGRTKDHRLHFAEIEVNLVHPLQGKEEEEEKGRGREDDGNPGRNGGKEREEGGNGGTNGGGGGDHEDWYEEEDYNPVDYNLNRLKNQEPVRIIIPHITVFFLI